MLKYVALLAFVLLTQHAYAGSSVWKISKGEDYFYLGGTIHVLSLADHPLPGEFTTAFGDVNTVIFETDMRELQSREFQADFLTAVSYGGERSLADELNAETYRTLKIYLDSRHLPSANFAGIKPWGLSLMITLLEYQRLGMEQQYGVDAHFYNLALAQGKKTRGLESVEDHLLAIRSMETIDPNTIINYTLRDLEQLPEFSRFMKKAWRSGNVEAFSTDPILMEMKTDFPAIYDALLTRRNTAWMTILVTLTDNDEREFVLVGAMHLNGEEGLLNQLAEAGFSVEQL